MLLIKCKTVDDLKAEGYKFKQNVELLRGKRLARISIIKGGFAVSFREAIFYRIFMQSRNVSVECMRYNDPTVAICRCLDIERRFKLPQRLVERVIN